MLREGKPIPPKSEPPDSVDVAGAVRWSAVAQYGSQAVQMAASIIVAWFVMPEDYGLLGMAVVLTGFLMQFQTMGFGPVIVQRKEISERLLSSLFYFLLAVGCGLCLLTAVGSPVVSWVYGDARVGPVVASLSILFVLSTAGVVPHALLTRRMAFGRLAVLDIGTGAIRAAVVIGLAVAGWGVWALVAESILGSALRVAGVFVLSGWRPRSRFHWSEVRSALGFGANMTGEFVCAYLVRDADKFFIGVFLGATPLGYYSLGYRILLLPQQAITGVLMRVLHPLLARLQTDDEQLKRMYLRACGAIAFTSCPAMLGILAIAYPLVRFVLGEKWLPAVPVVSVFSVLGIVLSLRSVVRPLFISKGRADLLFRWAMLSAFLQVVCVLAGLSWGIFGVAVAYTAASTITLLPGVWLSSRLVHGLRVQHFFATVGPHFLSAALMAVVVFAVRLALARHGYGDGAIVGACVAIGATVYTIMAYVRQPEALRDLTRVMPVPLRGVVLRMLVLRRA